MNWLISIKSREIELNFTFMIGCIFYLVLLTICLRVLLLIITIIHDTAIQTTVKPNAEPIAVITGMIIYVKPIREAIIAAVVVIFGKIVNCFVFQMDIVLLCFVPKKCIVMLELTVLKIFLYCFRKILSCNSIEQVQNET